MLKHKQKWIFFYVRLDWDVDQALRFQNFLKFTPEDNTLLKFRYEQLRGCEVCSMLAHDFSNYLIQNGKPDNHSDDEDDDNNHEH